MIKRLRRRFSRSPAPLWRSRLTRAIARHPLRSVGLGLCALLLGWLLINGIQLRLAAAQPVDAYLVLGGSIRREIYAAEVAKRSPTIPILISKGSEDPCIWLIFQRDQAPMQQVWLEKCADSTFDNFCFSLPTLRRWRSRHIRLITSATHLPRAMWMAQVMLGAHGIWVEPEIVAEQGVPANHESGLKTAMDLVRGGLWAIASHLYTRPCPDLLRLDRVNIAAWRQQGFKCERQANLDP
ncbi:MAG TPA: YdcF family protein [Chroococcidiopsis sp.]